MDPSDPENDKRETLDSTRRACDQCRLRKIRCDKRSPCSNCRSSKIVCRSTGAGQKPPEPRRRVLISSQYENKIDLIEERLANIEDVLRDLKSTITSSKPTSTSTSGPPGPSPAGPTSIPAPVDTNPDYHTTTTTNTNTSPTPKHTSTVTPATSGYASRTTAESSPPFEGNSSLAAHSAYASEFLETAVSQSALQMSSPKISAALSTLKQIVNMQDHQAHPSSSREVRLPNQKTIFRGAGLQDLAMPPMHVVLSLCRWVKESPPSIFQGYFPFISVDRFIEKCREVYFAIDDYSDATFIVVNGGLYNVFIECSFATKDHGTREECQKYLSLCRNNLETAMANLNLLMPAKPESIEALALGAIHAIEISKPSFAWTLTSTAARLCQTLGYHRASSMEHDSPSVQQAKAGLFWSTYCLDKALSLRLGRASSIQDYDISLSIDFGAGYVVEPWITIYPLWMRLARIQGKVYELLYSPAALSQPEDDRVSHARQLASEMQLTVMDPFKRVTSENFSLTEMQDFYIKSDKVSRYSVLTLIYRAIPPPPGSSSAFIPDCIESARAALEAHQVCMNTLKESNEVLKCSYMHWTILYAPFVPFIVLICHILEVPVLPPTSTTNTNTSTPTTNPDLTRLTDFVLSLRPLCAHSEAIANLHRLCQVLCSVARLYVEAKAKAKAKAQAQQTGGGGGGAGSGDVGGSANAAVNASAQSEESESENQVLASVGMEFDTYLSALGLAPPPTQQQQQQQQAMSSFGVVGGDGTGPWSTATVSGVGAGAGGYAAAPDTTMGSGPGPDEGIEANTNPIDVSQSQTAQLGNWFSGNQYMMGLLEEDLSLIDPSAWP